MRLIHMSAYFSGYEVSDKYVYNLKHKFIRNRRNAKPITSYNAVCFIRILFLLLLIR